MCHLLQMGGTHSARGQSDPQAAPKEGKCLVCAATINMTAQLCRIIVRDMVKDSIRGQKPIGEAYRQNKIQHLVHHLWTLLKGVNITFKEKKVYFNFWEN